MPRHRHRAADTGSSAVELVLVTPALIALVFLVVQAALVWHARQVATAAAQQGARLARADSVTAADPEVIRAQTLGYLRQLGADLVDTPSVTVTRAGGWVTVSVTGHAVSLLPGATLNVHATSRGTAEGYRP